MASQFYTHTRAAGLVTFTPFYEQKHRLLEASIGFSFSIGARCGRRSWTGATRVSNGGDSYLDLWQKAVDRERKAMNFRKIMENVEKEEEEGDGGGQELEMKSSEFLKILEVSPEERDRIQKMQVIDRAAAAIAAARALLKENSLLSVDRDSYESGNPESKDERESIVIGDQNEGSAGIGISVSGSTGIGTPGPNFWSWIPPSNSGSNTHDGSDLKSSGITTPSPNQPNPVMELEPYVDYLSLPLQSNNYPPLPPFQSLMEVGKQDAPQLEEKHEVADLFATHAQEAADALVEIDPVLCEGSYPDGSRWWKETGTEVRPDGVVCRWTLTRGVSADKAVEWEEKYWEAADELDYKELGSEKSGRDAAGNVWREFWKESMSQIEGCVHIEKTADKWGKNGKGDEWQEQWFEHYGAGQAEKWAHKWCHIDPTTQLEAGHAHVWHERWGEKYDGEGGSVKYTDKWAERLEGDGWTKWGDKWDENFSREGHGVKQGETWWEGKCEERWNRTWGEGHNGSGWVHKYGKSSSGEHWDTHVEQETWYERFPHYGFYHCFENSMPLRQVKKPSNYHTQN